MPAFFVIAGFFATLVLSRRGLGAWWRRRMVRLGVSLLFAALVVNTAASVTMGWWKGRFERGGLDAVGGTVVGRFGQVAHGWFLLDLLVFCSILAAGVALYRRSGVSWFRPAPLIERVTGNLPALLILFALLAVPAGWAAHELQELRLSSKTDHNLRPPIALYAAHFAFGCLIGSSRAALGNVLERAGWPMVVLAVVVSAPLVWEPTEQGGVSSVVRGANEVVAGLACAVLLLALFRTLADRDGWLWRYLVDASLPVYLVHYPLIYLFAKLMVMSGLGAITAAPPAVNVMTSAVASIEPIQRRSSAGEVLRTAPSSPSSAEAPRAGVTYSVMRNPGNVPVTGCNASSCSDTGLASGTEYAYTVTARLGSNWTASGQGSATTGTVAATKFDSTTTLTSSQSPTGSGQVVTYTATVNPALPAPTGSVTFKDGSSTINCTGGNQTLNAQRQVTCSVSYSATGARSITATYSGDSSYNSSSSDILTQRIVNASVVGIGFGNVEVKGRAVTPTCTGTLGTSSYVCAVNGGNNDAVTAELRFVSANGTATAYASDAATNLTWSATGKAVIKSGTITVAANSSAGTGVASAQKDVANAADIVVTFNDGAGNFAAKLVIN